MKIMEVHSLLKCPQSPNQVLTIIHTVKDMNECSYMDKVKQKSIKFCK